MVSQPSTTTFRAVVTVFQGIAAAVTFWRIYVRIKARRFWWDDAWAALALICNLVLLAAIWMVTSNSDLSPLPESNNAKIISYWLVSLMFTNCLWAARMSIVVSIIRFLPPGPYSARTTSVVMAVFFVLMWAALVIQKVVKCASSNAWHGTDILQCPLGEAVGILEICTDCIADIVLVAIPLRLLWRAKIPKDRRRLILVLFSASILTTLACIVHTCTVLGPAGVLEGITAHTEAAVALIVCNLLVLVTRIYGIITNGRDLESSPSDDTPSSVAVTSAPLDFTEVRSPTFTEISSAGLTRTTVDNKKP